MADRILDDIVETYMDWTSGTESPENYHLWTILGVLGAVCGQNYMQGDIHFTLANNLYFILFAKQGKTRKSTAIEIGLDLLEEVEQVKVSPSSISKEAMHAQMADCLNEHKESNYIIYAKELSSVIKTSGIDTANFLIALYDQSKRFENATIGRGSELILKPHISFMSATTPNFIRNGFGGLDMRENGLMSRTAIIYAEEPRNPDAFGVGMDKTVMRHLIHDLKVIAMDSPRRKLYFDEEAKEAYRKYYIKIHTEEASNPVEEAFLARKELHVLKIACLLTVAKKPSDDEDDNTGLEIRTVELDMAIEIVEKVQHDLVHIHQLLGTDPLLHIKLTMRDAIRKRRRISTQELSTMVFAETGTAELRAILTHLVDTGTVMVEDGWAIWIGPIDD